MNVCLDGLTQSPICLGSVMEQLHGSEGSITHSGIAILAIVFVAVAVFVFRSPA